MRRKNTTASPLPMALDAERGSVGVAVNGGSDAMGLGHRSTSRSPPLTMLAFDLRNW